MPFYMDIAEPARNRATKKLRALTEAEMDPMGLSLAPQASAVYEPDVAPGRAPIVSGPDVAQPLPLASTTPSPISLAEARIARQGAAPEGLGIPAMGAPKPPTPAELDILGATLPEPTPTWDPRGREKGMEVAAQEAAAGGFRGQTIDLTVEMARNEKLIAALAERGVKVNPVSTFSSEGAGMRALMALGVTADVVGSLFESIAETGWESVKFATVGGDVPTLFKEGFVASVEQHRQRGIAAQIALGVVFDPFVIGKVFTIPAKATGPVLRSTIKSQLIDLAENNASTLAGREIDDVVEEIATQYERKNLSPTEYQAATRARTRSVTSMTLTWH